MQTSLAIDYGALMRDALRGVLRGALTQVAADGLSEPHHFVIAFSTVAPGVVLPGELRREHPELMTIVLQHRFAQLEVSRDTFEVTLWFAGSPKRLVVPFAAVVAWSDPGAGVSLQVGQIDDAESPEELDDAPAASAFTRPRAAAVDANNPAPGQPIADADASDNVVRFERPARRRPTATVAPGTPPETD